MLPKNIKKSLLAGEYEKTPEGIYLSKEKTLVNGVFRYNKRGEAEEFSENLVVDEALDYILGAAIATASPISSWYVATFSGDVTVLNTWTGGNFPANSTEWTNYVSAGRPAWTNGAVSAGGVDSFTTKAEFESTQDTQIVRGAALISSAAKGIAGGTLMAASRFPSDKNLDTGEILDVGYGLQLTAV